MEPILRGKVPLKPAVLRKCVWVWGCLRLGLWYQKCLVNSAMMTFHQSEIWFYSVHFADLSEDSANYLPAVGGSWHNPFPTIIRSTHLHIHRCSVLQRTTGEHIQQATLAAARRAHQGTTAILKRKLNEKWLLNRFHDFHDPNTILCNLPWEAGKEILLICHDHYPNWNKVKTHD